MCVQPFLQHFVRCEGFTDFLVYESNLFNWNDELSTNTLWSGSKYETSAADVLKILLNNVEKVVFHTSFWSCS